MVLLAVGVALVIVAGVKLTHRPGPGRADAGTGVGGLGLRRHTRLACLPRLADAAPRTGLRSALLLSQDLAPGMLTVEAEGLAWRPARLSRWSGAKAWRVPRSELRVVETGPVPGVARIGGGLAVLVWLDGGQSLPMRAISPKGLVPALEEVGLTALA